MQVEKKTLNEETLCVCTCLAQDHSLWAKLFLGGSWCFLCLLPSPPWCPLPDALDSFLPRVSAARPGRGPSTGCPFPRYTVAVTHSDPSSFQHCCRGGSSAAMQTPFGFADLFKLRTGEAGSFSYNYVGVRSFWGMKVTLGFFSGLHILIWREDFQDTSAEREQLWAAEYVSGKYESGDLFSVVSWKRNVYGQFKGIQNFRQGMASERICFEL